jgi:hypothetical protein
MDHRPDGERVLGMRSSGVAKAVAGGFLFFGVSWGGLLVTTPGCSSDDTAAPTKPAAAGVCPNTVKQAAGAACTQEGMACGIGYTCAAFPQQAQCNCTHGKFVCTDATGAAVAANRDPQCVPPGTGNDVECPKSEVGTMDKACMTAGLLCYYSGPVCPENNGVPNRDVCQCKGSPLKFECEPQPCHPRSDASDDQFVPPPPDAKGDAPADVGNDG